jgi:hypothetical protein
MSIEVAKQGGSVAAPAPTTTQDGSWVSGLVTASVGDLSSSYTVSLDAGPTVAASSVINAPVTVGTRVWVVRTGGNYLVVGLQ